MCIFYYSGGDVHTTYFNIQLKLGPKKKKRTRRRSSWRKKEEGKFAHSPSYECVRLCRR